MHCCVTFEPPRSKRDIPQCANCQQYGHTKGYRGRKPKCIKCAGNHSSSNCARKDKSDDVKCILCERNHPANYKGCIVYRNFQKLKYPPMRRKQNSATVTNYSGKNIKNIKAHQTTCPEVSYAQSV